MLACQVSSSGCSSLLRRSCNPRQLASFPFALTNASNSCIRQAQSIGAGSHAPLRRTMTTCPAFDGKDGGRSSGKAATVQFNPVYAGICAGYAALMLLHNPYIFAALTIITIIPQNSATTSLNSLVLLFYDSGLFMNFAGDLGGSSYPHAHCMSPKLPPNYHSTCMCSPCIACHPCPSPMIPCTPQSTPHSHTLLPPPLVISVQRRSTVSGWCHGCPSPARSSALHYLHSPSG